MTDTVKLNDVVKESGVTITFIAEKMGCSRNRVYSILNGSECSASEIVALAKLLHLTDKQRDDIFLSKMLTESKQGGV